jgi:hypothetical protein
VVPAEDTEAAEALTEPNYGRKLFGPFGARGRCIQMSDKRTDGELCLGSWSNLGLATVKPIRRPRDPNHWVKQVVHLAKPHAPAAEPMEEQGKNTPAVKRRPSRTAKHHNLQRRA